MLTVVPTGASPEGATVSRASCLERHRRRSDRRPAHCSSPPDPAARTRTWLVDEQSSLARCDELVASLLEQLDRLGDGVGARAGTALHVSAGRRASRMARPFRPGARSGAPPCRPGTAGAKQDRPRSPWRSGHRRAREDLSSMRHLDDPGARKPCKSDLFRLTPRPPRQSLVKCRLTRRAPPPIAEMGDELLWRG
jgi:hypothetical protein